jgi:hypothetical protein
LQFCIRVVDQSHENAIGEPRTPPQSRHSFTNEKAQPTISELILTQESILESKYR